MTYKEWRLLFHWPLPLTVVALTTFGAIVSPTLHIDRLIITYLLIFFGLVLAAYSFDALAADWKFLIKGIKQWQLLTLSIIGLLGFIAISIYAIIVTSLTGIVVAIILLIFVVCYNLETPKLFHNKWMFGISWGSIPIIASYYYQSLNISIIMIPLGISGFIVAMQEWYQTNTKSPAQQAISGIPKDNLERKILRKETFRMTSYMCYSLFAISMTILIYRLL